MLKLTQLILDFQAGIRGSLAERRLERPLFAEPEPPAVSRPVNEGEDAELTALCHELLLGLELTGAAGLVRVFWNPRLRSTAGYASYPAWRIELNPRLRELEGQVDRTLRHELAHLVAYHRAGRRRIEPHGAEWRRACAALGIPDESARHRLPLPRRKVKRKFAYTCAHCGLMVHRVRKFRRLSACSACCTKHNGGQYDARFRFILLAEAPSNEAD
jgi:predicted SprT family Zn-dependent metalloprotease